MLTFSSATTRRWRWAQQFELWWWRRYLGRRDWFAYLAQKKAGWWRLLEGLHLPLAAGMPVLDAGCGPAGIFTVLFQQQVTALDPLLGAYRWHFPELKAEVFPHVVFVEQALEDYVADQPFAGVFCLNAINHVADWSLALHRLWEATAPGGFLVLGSDVHRWAWLKYLFRLIPGDVLHPQQHCLADYRQQLLQQGWHLEQALRWRSGRIFDYWVLVATKPPFTVPTPDSV